MPDYQQTSLWKATFAPRESDPHEKERSKLRTAYETFWKRSVLLAETIAKDLPGLTLHGEAHFSALWDRASQLVGESSDINPLEAFVFGGAILLHDTGHAIAAYEGGRSAIEATNEYRDTLVSLLRRQKDGGRPTNEEIAHPSSELADAALFNALRILHAKQAKALINHQFSNKYLLEDSDIRENLGEIIGQIAASHQDDRNNLPDILPQQQNSPGDMPREWIIRPIYLACLLRCADAIQIDQTRAPPFLLAINAPSGLSRLHWIAQQLAQPAIQEQANGACALVFTSQRSFQEADADAWWVAYDLIQTANVELKECHNLLQDQKLPTFTVDHVLDSEIPSHLSKHVRTSGWTPLNAEIRVTDANKIIDLFGGHTLYGRDPTVPLRELIQNAADAIRARKHYGKSTFFEGRIIVKIYPSATSDTWTITVEDNGIGMSEQTMRGPFLEFGKSFWNSNDAASEFPGLAALNLNQTGKYGIGFFSVLMLSSQIKIVSKRYDKGHSEARTMIFRDGLKLRPLISHSGGDSLGDFSTRIELEISTNKKDRLLSIWMPPDNNVSVDLRTIIAHICCCLDCDVYVNSDNELIKAHSSSWAFDDPLPWLQDCTFSEARADHDLDSYISKSRQLLQPIFDCDNEPTGRASIAFRSIPAGIATIGRLVLGSHSRSIQSFNESFLGSLAFEGHGPSRLMQTEIANRSNVEIWASAQATLAATMDFNDSERYLISYNVALRGGNPMPTASVVIDRKIFPLATLLEHLTQGQNAYFVLSKNESQREHFSMGQIVHAESAWHHFSLRDSEIKFSALCIEAFSVSRHDSSSYHYINKSKKIRSSIYSWVP